VQIVTKQGRQVVAVEHLGSAHTDADLSVLVETAREGIRERIRETGQVELDLGLEGAAAVASSRVVLKRSYSRVLFEALTGVYDRLGFTTATKDDAVFRDLVIARIIEPPSKLDTIRILDELGLKPPSNTGIHRCLDRVAGGGLSGQALRGVCDVSWGGAAHARALRRDDIVFPG
jgi:hypothetical protein